MGSIFSQEEKKEMAPCFQGVDPLSLAEVIMDTINEEGMDENEEEEGNIGISFNGGSSAEGDNNNVVFWDNGEITSLPKNIFLEMVKMTAEHVIKTFEDNYDLENSEELGESVATLRVALERLEEHLSTVECTISPEEYKRLLDEETESEEMESDEETPISKSTEEEAIQVPTPIQEIPEILENLIHGNPDYSEEDSNSSEASTPPPDHLLQRRKSTKGIVGVMDRLPELRRRVGDEDVSTPPQSPQSPQPPLAFNKVKKKVKLLSLFHRPSAGRSTEKNQTKLKTDDENPASTPKSEEHPSTPETNENQDMLQTTSSKATKIAQPRSSSFDNFFQQQHHMSHQFSTSSLPGDLSKTRQSSSQSNLLSPRSPQCLSLPGSVLDVSSSTPNSPISPKSTHFSFMTPGSPSPPGSLSTTPQLSGLNSISPLWLGNGSNPSGGAGTKLLPDSPPSSTFSFPTVSRGTMPSGSLDTNSPTPPPGTEANRHHLAWASSLDSNSSTSTPPAEPNTFPTQDCI